MQRPSQYILEITKNSVDNSLSNQKENIEGLEKILIWITSFSIIAFGFIATQITSLQLKYSHGVLKWIMIIQGVSILTAIVHRFSFYYWRTNIQILNHNFKMMFADNEDLMEIDAEDVSRETDIKEVIRLLRENFGEDLSHVLPMYESADEITKNFFLEDIKKHYGKVQEWTIRDYQMGIDLIKKYYKIAYGATDKEAEKVLNADVKKLVRNAKTISIFSLYLSFISFLLSILILIINF